MIHHSNFPFHWQISDQPLLTLFYFFLLLCSELMVLSGSREEEQNAVGKRHGDCCCCLIILAIKIWIRRFSASACLLSIASILLFRCYCKGEPCRAAKHWSWRTFHADCVMMAWSTWLVHLMQQSQGNLRKRDSWCRIWLSRYFKIL